MRNNNSEKVFEIYEKVLSEQSDAIMEKLVKNLIRMFQKIKRNSGMMQSPEDSGLENLWDEICVQTQDEYSFYWETYVDYIKNVIDDEIEKMTLCQVLLIWFQTEEFFELSCDTEDEENNNDLTFYNPEAVRDYIFDKLLSESTDYHNARIEKYIDTSTFY